MLCVSQPLQSLFFSLGRSKERRKERDQEKEVKRKREREKTMIDLEDGNRNGMEKVKVANEEAVPDAKCDGKGERVKETGHVELGCVKNGADAH